MPRRDVTRGAVVAVTNTSRARRVPGNVVTEKRLTHVGPKTIRFTVKR